MPLRGSKGDFMKSIQQAKNRMINEANASDPMRTLFEADCDDETWDRGLKESLDLITGMHNGATPVVNQTSRNLGFFIASSI
jgi:hypothetical protein